MTHETATLPMSGGSRTTAPAASGGSHSRRRRHALLWAAASIGCLGAAGAMHYLVEAGVTRGLSEEAAARGRVWAEHFFEEIAGLDEVLQTGALQPEDRHFITATAKASGAFDLRLYDPRGRLAFRSSRLQDPAAKTMLRDHEAGAVKAITGNQEVVKVFAGHDDASLPDIYATAFVPFLTSDGEVRGVLGLYLDQSRAGASLRNSYRFLALSITALAAPLLIAMTMLALRGRTGHGPVAPAAVPVESRSSSVTGRYGEEQSAGHGRGNFDDWLASITEDAAQAVPERVAVECHLGLGNAGLPGDADEVENVIKGLIATAADALSADQGGDGKTVVLMPRIIVATAHTGQGIEVSISDNRLRSENTEESNASLKEFIRLRQGRLETEVLAQGNRVTVWWPAASEQAEAA